MAKNKENSNSNQSDGRELIVVVQPNAGIRSMGKSVSSASGNEVDGLNSMLSNFDASLVPIFANSGRAAVNAPFAVSALENANIDVSAFFRVESKGNLDELAEAFLNEGIVESAYIKPAAEPPFIDEDNFSPDLTIDAPPVTPNFIARQIYLNASPAGIDAKHAWTLPGGKGNNVRIIDIEGAWRYSHEDLVVNQGGVIGGTQSTDLRWRNHGTAVVGEFGGDENSFGITGICPAANSRAVSIFGTGQSSAKAIVDAANALSAGDIILLELHRPGPRHNFAGRDDQLGYIAIEWWPDDYAAILYATSKKILVVEAAGNGAENLNDAIYNTRPAGFPASWRNPFNTANPSSKAIIVGAGAPPPGTHGRDHGPDRSRLGFSNYGSRVDCQGWGREVTTCGYGDLQGGGNENFWYTDTFSGTSSASPIVVGALGCIQGRLKNRAKPLLTPTTAINLLRTTGSPQQDAPGRPASQRIGNRPNLKQAFSTLGIGGVIKIKDVKEIKEFKEKEKEKEVKEFKEKEKEFKEKDKDIKEFKEKDKDFERPPSENIQGNLEIRIQNLEANLQQLSHFINTSNRPELESSLFQDQSENDQISDLQKNANDAKGMKDNKDMEAM